ncbi:ankyrin, partial [Choiromyces venosus 120613-1]
MDETTSRGPYVSGNNNCFNVKNNYNYHNEISNTTIVDQKAEIMQWLSPLEPQQRHQHIRESRLEGVGKWVFQTREFMRWNTEDSEDGSANSVLFCYGDPGVGKTHLSSLVIDHFHGSGQEITVIGLYCDYLDREAQTTSNMLGAMLKQLVGSGNIPGDVHKAFEDGRKLFGGVGPQPSELLKMLKTTLAQRQRVVICIDGLDESLPEHRTGLLKSLQDIVRELPSVRLFLTARPFIRSEVEKYFPEVDTISVSPTKEDTEAFLRNKLDDDPESDAMDDILRAEIMKMIPDKVSEIFLLVSLTIEAILGETTISRRRKKLNEVTGGRGVGDLYTATLERINAQKGSRPQQGMEVLMWISHSLRPLNPDELCHALGVEIGASNVDHDNIPSIRTVLGSCLGLVTVDSSSSTVRLVHFTLQEYILAHPTLFHTAHSMIAEVCLTYLNFECINDLSPTLPSSPPTTPFLEYASRYWGAHTRRETTEAVTKLALRVLDCFDTHISCKLLLYHNPDFEEAKWIYLHPLGFTGLHGAAFFDLVEIMVPLLETRQWDLNAPDFGGNTALEWAAKRGHESALSLLLERCDVDPNIANTNCQELLCLAARHGHEGVLKLLLKRGNVSLDKASNGGPPLCLATIWGHVGVVKVLLELSDVNPNSADEEGRTPFSWAAGNGEEEIVLMLLERKDVDFNMADSTGRTPLSWAAENGHEAIVETLLERSDIDPNMADNNGRTPLSWAAEGGDGHVSVVEMLLARDDVNPNAADNSGTTPL